jgi:putative ABC transport system substrate-binding protein
MIGRRAFVGMVSAGCLARWRGRGEAQPSTKDPRVAYFGGRLGFEVNGRAFIEGLREHGYVPGRNLILDVRTYDTAKMDSLDLAANEAVATGADVIFASNPQHIEAAVKATRVIPIVGVDLESDPVARGWVATLAKPGGNFTGFFLDTPEISGKQLQFLKEVRSDISRVAVLGDPRVNEPQFTAIETVARSMRLTLQLLRIKAPDAIVPAIADVGRQRAGALVILTSPLVFSRLDRIADAAVAHRLPAISPFSPRFAEVGGLLAYGADIRDLFRRSAAYVDRIIKGAKPRELPIQRPEKFLLVLNLKTARALKLTLPMALVQRSDRVIE